MTDIFSLTDTSDLPEKLRPNHRHEQMKPRGSLYEILVAKAGRPVSMTEVRAARFRDSGVEVSCSAVRQSLALLASQGRIQRVGVGLYAANDWKPPA